jgi:predicted transcriptional regulator
MKTATLPSLRVEPKLRKAAESVLHEGESLSSFMEQSLRDEVNRRRMQAEFIARGLAARDEARRTGVYHDADTVHAELRGMLAEAKAKTKAKPKA